MPHCVRFKWLWNGVTSGMQSWDLQHSPYKRYFSTVADIFWYAVVWQLQLRWDNGHATSQHERDGSQQNHSCCGRRWMGKAHGRKRPWRFLGLDIVWSSEVLTDRWWQPMNATRTSSLSDHETWPVCCTVHMLYLSVVPVFLRIWPKIEYSIIVVNFTCLYTTVN